MKSGLPIEFRNDLAGVDWAELKAALTADDFDNGRTALQLQQSFENSQRVCIARCGVEVMGTARVLSDGVCNAYLIDVWTKTGFRRQGVAREMIERVCGGLAGQHVYLQSDGDTVEFYRRIGFAEQPAGMSRVVGRWLMNE